MTRRELRSIHYRGNFSVAGNDGFLSAEPGEHGFRGLSNDLQVANKSTELLEAGESVVLSSESFLGSMKYVYPEAGERALEMLNTFGALGPFQVVIYLRPQHEWIESVYTQIVQEGSQQEADSFFEGVLGSKNLQFSNLVADLKAALGPQRLVVRTYSAGQDTVVDFLSVLGVPVPRRFSRRFEANRSITPTEVALLRSLNGFFSPEETRAVRFFLQGADSRRGSQVNRDEHSNFSIEAQREALNLTLQDWQRLTTEVEDTRAPNLGDFHKVVEVIGRTSPRQYVLAPNSGLNVDEEAKRTLAAACTVLEDERQKNLSLTESILRKVSENPSDLPGAGYRFFLRYFSRLT